MSNRGSVLRRVGTAKTLGFIVGLAAFLAMPVYWPDETLMLRIGFLFWYTTFGAIIGMFGLLNTHPMFKMPLPFWFRGIFYGGWLNLVVTILMYDRIAAMMAASKPPFDGFRSPYWFVLEGMIVGLVIDWVATRVGGEGREI